MVVYRRNKVDSINVLYFLTLATEPRRAWFAEREHYVLLWERMRRCIEGCSAAFEAWVLLPDHIHWVIRPGTGDYSKIVSSFKRGILFDYRERDFLGGEKTLWQSRFWEHTIRDDADYARCLDYVHYNPVKHGHAPATALWAYSSFRAHVKQGHYPIDWGADVNIPGAEFDMCKR